MQHPNSRTLKMSVLAAVVVLASAPTPAAAYPQTGGIVDFGSPFTTARAMSQCDRNWSVCEATANVDGRAHMYLESSAVPSFNQFQRRVYGSTELVREWVLAEPVTRIEFQAYIVMDQLKTEVLPRLYGTSELSTTVVVSHDSCGSCKGYGSDYRMAPDFDYKNRSIPIQAKLENKESADAKIPAGIVRVEVRHFAALQYWYFDSVAPGYIRFTMDSHVDLLEGRVPDWMPDLHASNLRVETPVRAHEQTTIRVDVQNVGLGYAEATRASVMIKHNGTWTKAYVGVPALASGGQASIEIPWKPTAAGIHTVSVYVNAYQYGHQTIAEKQGAPNRVEASVMVAPG